MKKYLGMTALLFLAISCKSEKEKAKENQRIIIESCVVAARGQVGSMVPQNVIENYCNCSTTKLIDAGYTEKDITTIFTNQNQKEQDKMIEILKPCLSEFEQQISEQ